MSWRPKRDALGIMLLALTLAAGCNSAADSMGGPSCIDTLDGLLARMRSEKHFASSDEYVEHLEKLRAQLLAQSIERANREKVIRDLSERIEKLEEELDFLKEHTKVELEGIEIAFYSGGKDADKDGKDDYIEAAVCPIDADGHIMKAIGKCRFELYRKSFIGMGRVGRRLMHWEFSYEEVNKAWIDTLFSGYTFELRWGESPPLIEDVVLEAVFETPDGREFAARKGMRLKF